MSKRQQTKSTSSAVIRATAFVVKVSPIYEILLLASKTISSLLPAVQATILVGLYDAAATYLDTFNWTALLFWTIMLLISYLTREALDLFFDYGATANVLEKCTMSTSEAILDKSLNLPYISWYKGDFLNLQKRALNCVENDTFFEIFTSCCNLVGSVLGLAGTIIVLGSYNIWFVAIALGSVLPNLFARIIRGKNFYKTYRSFVGKSRRTEYLLSLFLKPSSINDMRSLGGERYLADLWHASRNEVNRMILSQGEKDARTVLACDVIKTIGYLGSLAGAILLTLSGSISIGIFAACISTFSSLQSQSKFFLIELGNLPLLFSYAKDFLDYIDLPEEENQHRIEQIGRIDCITFDNVSFSYPNAKHKALDAINLKIESGASIAIVGENGSGKTTLGMLLLGLFDPTEGRIEINGSNLSDLSPSCKRRLFSAMQQDYLTMNLSIQKNITMFCDGSIISDDEIAESLSLAFFDSKPYPYGIMTELGREFGGVELSGGQKQRLSIARCLCRKNARLLVMDEPTSSMDPIAESEIFNNILGLSRGKTSFIITHRAGLCRFVDKIIVLQKGRLVGFGTHSELLTTCNAYRDIYTAQSSWYQQKPPCD